MTQAKPKTALSPVYYERRKQSARLSLATIKAQGCTCDHTDKTARDFVCTVKIIRCDERIRWFQLRTL